MTDAQRAIERLARRRARYAERKAAGTLPQRDYTAEENRRNIRAQEFGFPTRAQLRSARRAGIVPTERERRRQSKEFDPTSGNVNRWTGTVLSPDEIAFMRGRNLDWSKKHSQSVNSKYNPRWGDDKAVMYYMLYVYGWNPEFEPYPVIGFRAPADDQSQDLIFNYFRSIGMTAATIHKFNYTRGD